MDERRQLLEAVAAYRDLNPEERQALAERLAHDPGASELLKAYQEMDEQLVQLPDPRPEPEAAQAFRRALADEEAGGHWLAGWVERTQTVAGQAAAVGLLLGLVLAAGFLFRDQLQLLGTAPTATSSPIGGSALPAVVPADQGVTPTPPSIVSFSDTITPTPAVTVDANAPFAPFAEYMARWPEQVGMAHGALRAGMKAYLAGNGGISRLQDPALMADLESRLRPLVPVWGEDALQLVDIYPGGTPELVVAVLPFIDVYTEEAGVVHVRGLGIPRHGAVERSWPVEVQVVDLDGFMPEIVVTYYADERGQQMAEVLVAQFETVGNYWVERWRTAVPQPTALALDPVVLEPEAARPRLTITCPAFGPFDLPLSAGDGYPRLPRRDVYVWGSTTFVPASSERAAPQGEAGGTRRQYANVAEAYLRSGDLREALARYRLLAAGEVNLPAAPQDPAWRTVGALRAGQIHALLGEVGPAQEMLNQARLSSTQLGRVAGIFGERYAETGDVVAAWSALFTDGDLIEEMVSQGNGLAGGPADRLALFYPGMALAAAIGDVTPADLAQLAPEALLARWQQSGLGVGAGRIDDMDGDGELEIVVEQLVPSPAEGRYLPVSLLDYGPQGWYAVPLGELGQSGTSLSNPLPAPDGNYLLIDVGGTLAGWDGQLLHYWQPRTAGYEVQLRSRRPEHLCPLPGPERVEYALLGGASTMPTAPPAPVPAATPTPTPWDQEGMPTPATPYPGPGGAPSPSPTPPN